MVRERAEARRSTARARAAPIVVKQEAVDQDDHMEGAVGGIPTRRPAYAPPPLEISPRDSPMPTLHQPRDDLDSDPEFDAQVQRVLDESRITSANARRALQAATRAGAGAGPSTSASQSDSVVDY